MVLLQVFIVSTDYWQQIFTSFNFAVLFTFQKSLEIKRMQSLRVFTVVTLLPIAIINHVNICLTTPCPLA